MSWSPVDELRPSGTPRRANGATGAPGNGSAMPEDSRFGGASEPPSGERAATANAVAAPPRLGTILAQNIERAERRADGREKPIKFPWPTLNGHFGNGLWAGLHVINKGTGVGGTQLALQVGVHAAKNNTPVLYIGLELGEADLALRTLGEEARVPWSALWTGDAGPAYIARVRAAIPRLEDLPFHHEVAPPHGFPASALLASVESMRRLYPETNGPGSRPLLVIVDFLQLIGDEPKDDQDLRIRIGRASYVLRDIANRLGVVVLAISSVARERYKLLNDIHVAADLRWDTDSDGCPINRRIGNTDAIVGAGKESGEIEYSADSVSVIARVPQTWTGDGCDVVFATAKGRATGAMWSPLRFTNFRYEECSDRGGRMVDAWKEAGERRARAAEDKKTAKDMAKVNKAKTDADAVLRYVTAHPGCTVRDARAEAVNDDARRWKAAVEFLGSTISTSKGCFVVGGVDVDNPPHTPPVSTSTGGRPSGLPVDGVDGVDERGQSTPSKTSTPSPTAEARR